ncbi:MAG: phosphate signaling complex protein PhoU [Gammaproteobacteria bacterium]|jgi:phosphate transport system protein
MKEEDDPMIQPMEGHTVHRFDGELNNLHMMILEMGGLVLDQVQQGITAVTDKNMAAARLVIDREPNVDALEVKIDEENIIVIAKRCPVGKDLRITTMVSKAVTDLERIGDEAARIANQAIQMYDNDSNDPGTHLLRDIKTMGKLSSQMLHDALEIFDTFDVERAQKLAAGNVELDEEFQSSLRRLATFVLEDARNVGHTINITLIIKALERVGEHARNLAEYVIYFVKGEDVRHQAATYPGNPDNKQ